MYTLNGIDLETAFGFLAGKQPGGNIALAGFLDMPARLGKCYHSWGSFNGVEPYTSADEIRLGGRDLSLTGYILGTDRADCLNKITALFTLVNSFTSLVPLACAFGTYQVYVKAPIVGSYIAEQGLKVDISFREPLPVITGTMPDATIGNDLGIDGITFETMGGFLSAFEGDNLNRPVPKAQEFTAFEFEGYQITKAESAKLQLKIFIEQADYTAFKTKINSLYMLFKAPGERTLIIANDLPRQVFACSGFKVTNVNQGLSLFYGFVEVEVVQAKIVIPIEPPYNGIVDDLNNKFTFNANDFGTPTPPPTSGIVDDLNNEFTFTPNTI